MWSWRSSCHNHNAYIYKKPTTILYKNVLRNLLMFKHNIQTEYLHVQMHYIHTYTSHTSHTYIHACMLACIHACIHTYTVHTTVCIQIDWFDLDLDLDCFFSVFVECVYVGDDTGDGPYADGYTLRFCATKRVHRTPREKRPLKEKNIIRSHKITWRPLTMKLTKVVP